MVFIIIDTKHKKSYSQPLPGMIRTPRTLFQSFVRTLKYALVFMIFIAILMHFCPRQSGEALQQINKLYTHTSYEISGLLNGSISYAEFASDIFVFYLKHNIGMVLELL